ncbi:DUF3219 family protein [Aquibacillus sediminis]|uniref:DUF3219 family protein n=1 Tax=Aquibacillus sediminis TaxID=2574734 RepID=UPI00110896F5|nr:DUF3219 family protein [Aquibacillus sediminis]
MVTKVRLNDTPIAVEGYQRTVEDGQTKISFHFQVTHEEYHAITTLLYEGTFDVTIPEEGVAFRGTIYNYSTSITNLYKQGEVGEFYLSLVEVI